VDVGDDAAPPSSSSSPLELDEKDDRGLAGSLFLRLRVHCTCALSLHGGADDGDRDGMVLLLRSLGRMLCTKLAGLEESSFLEDWDLVNLVCLAAPLLL
jgi:hypothetical protein